MNRAAAEWLPASRRFRALCCTAAFRRAFSSAHCALSVSSNSLSRAASSRLSSRSFVSRSIFACQVSLVAPSSFFFFWATRNACSSVAAASVGVRQGRCAAFFAEKLILRMAYTQHDRQRGRRYGFGQLRRLKRIHAVAVPAAADDGNTVAAPFFDKGFDCVPDLPGLREIDILRFHDHKGPPCPMRKTALEIFRALRILRRYQPHAARHFPCAHFLDKTPFLFPVGYVEKRPLLLAAPPVSSHF